MQIIKNDLPLDNQLLIDGSILPLRDVKNEITADFDKSTDFTQGASIVKNDGFLEYYVSRLSAVKVSVKIYKGLSWIPAAELLLSESEFLSL